MLSFFFPPLSPEAITDKNLALLIWRWERARDAKERTAQTLQRKLTARTPASTRTAHRCSAPGLLTHTRLSSLQSVKQNHCVFCACARETQNTASASEMLQRTPRPEGRRSGISHPQPRPKKHPKRLSLEKTIVNNSHAYCAKHGTTKCRGGNLNIHFKRTFERKNKHMAYV